MSRRVPTAFLAVLALAACGGGSSVPLLERCLVGSRPRRTDPTVYGSGTGDDVAMDRTKVAKRAIAPAKIENPEGPFNPQAS